MSGSFAGGSKQQVLINGTNYIVIVSTQSGDGNDVTITTLPLSRSGALLLIR